MQEIYYLAVLIITAGFAVYDNRYKRVPDKALVLFLPVALAAPFINAAAENAGFIERSALIMALVYAFAGAAAGFIILLSSALMSKNGNGVGGGDIKLIGVLGFIYGVAGIIYILIISSFSAMAAGLYIQRKNGNRILRLPFVPYILAGVLAVTIFGFIL